MTVIYIDILLTLNLFIDFLLLAATARVLQRPTKRWRLISGALVGALSALVILLPALPAWLSLLHKLGSATLMVAAAFPFQKPTLFLKTTAVLFVISAIFSGVCTGGYLLLSPVGFMVQSGIVYYNVSPLLLVGLTSLSYGVLCLYDRITRKRAARGFAYRISIIDGDCHVMLKALLDSGHSLKDSFSGSPVILVQESAVRALRSRYDLSTVGAGHVGHIRYIPFSSIGGDGVLMAFRPQTVTLYGDNRCADISGVWIAATTALGRGEYEALISPAIAELL